jgi:hypothetical protein
MQGQKDKRAQVTKHRNDNDDGLECSLALSNLV